MPTAVSIEIANLYFANTNGELYHQIYQLYYIIKKGSIGLYNNNNIIMAIIQHHAN